MATEKSKVKITSLKSTVIFDASPNSLGETRRASYDPWSLVHLPVDLYAYKNSSSRTWSISAPLISRTPEEAEANAGKLHTIRSWLLPDFALSGAPPEILKFYAYSDPNINGVTCILTDYNWSYDNVTDYIVGNGSMETHKMPTIGTISLTLVEVYTATEIQNRVWAIKNVPGNGGSEGSSPSPSTSDPAQPSIPPSDSPVQDQTPPGEYTSGGNT
jgi:hypothetical protein